MHRHRAWYDAPISEFLASADSVILGSLTSNADWAVVPEQRTTWLAQIRILRESLAALPGHLFLEFAIPRMGRRVDAIVIVGGVLFCVEFKIIESKTGRAALDQVWDYALDLKNFHEPSHSCPIVPLLVAPSEDPLTPLNLVRDADDVIRPLSVPPSQLRDAITLTIELVSAGAIDPSIWMAGSYRPTPTIIEAARALYSSHTVAAIARFDAGAKNLARTSKRVDEIINEAVAGQKKAICFVTGVPGAGKTLVGLNVATQHRRDEDAVSHAVFLSGNGPLVKVLREALARDEVARGRALGRSIRKSGVVEEIKAFIQNVHHFRDDGLIEVGPPSEHVVIFDEAQRAWNLRQTCNFMRQKKKRPNFNQSEPDFLISFMDRHRDWAVIICLVGGGQEINTGEAGIQEWVDAIGEKYAHWNVHISPELAGSEYGALDSLRKLDSQRIEWDSDLHLSVSMRSFRAENVSTFVKALIDIDRDSARHALHQLRGRFPIAITRDLGAAKNWIRQHARGSERVGLVASSRAMRLKPHAIDVRVDVDPVHWFLNAPDDTRSSCYLEDAATEFQVQGLELDWVCVTWDGDLRFTEAVWGFHDFRGSRWCNVNTPENRHYVRNAYRVLLTRARQGMVIFVPPGDPDDPTRLPRFYDGTFEYLRGLGVPTLESLR